MKRSSEQIFDELLILRCQANDKEAVGLLWKRWNPRILKWSFDFLHDQDLAYEVAQDSWLSIFQSIPKLKDPSLFKFWVYRIVQRRSADQIRKLQKERKINDELCRDVEPVKQKELELTQSPDEAALMLEAIKALPEQHQQILKLHYLENHSVKVIALLTELPEGTVKSRLFYARKYLKEQLKEVYHEQDRQRD